MDAYLAGSDTTGAPTGAPAVTEGGESDLGMDETQ
jgi:hypothetical protein